MDKHGVQPACSAKRAARVNSGNEYIGLLVSRISDVVEADWDKVEPPPANIGGVQGKFFKGVFKTKERLIGILDVEKVLDNEQ